MQEPDYKKLGLRCGLEIHQQLDTHKLFCNCPSIIREDAPDFEIKRNLRATVGESGEIDKAALHEQKKKKYYTYQGYTDTTCLVELDEEPPHVMNQEALRITLQVSLMLNAKIVDEVQVMRKTVVDGSNTTGFQRTALVARRGHIETKDGKINIPSISIEEDACKIIKRTKDHDIYNLSRLGIPLIEIGTDPDIKTPEQAKETAEKLGMVLRSTGTVKRGLGTIRQDINISIKGGVRTEIKGAQDLRLIPKLVKNEVIRQINLLNLPKKVKISKITDLTKELSKTSSNVLRKSLDNKGSVLGIKIEGFDSKLKEHISPGKRLGTELSDYAKIKAGVGGLFHSDELPNYGISQKEVDVIKKELKLKQNDAFIIIADNKNISEKAFDAVIHRLNQPLVEEVRKANDDATTSFLRPMPGSARMYPETDTIPITPDVKNIKLPELIEEKIRRYEKDYKISNDLATQLVKSGIPYEDYIKKYKNVSPNLTANLFILTPKEIKKKTGKEIDFNDYADEILSKIDNNSINSGSATAVLYDIAEGKKIDYSLYRAVDDKDIENQIKEIIYKNKGAPFGALMGIAMEKFRGKVEGKKVFEILRKYVK